MISLTLTPTVTVSSDVHISLVRMALAVGYRLMLLEKFLNSLHGFDVPPDVSIDGIKDDVPIEGETKRFVSDLTFGSESTVGKHFGGFIEFEESYRMEDVHALILLFNALTGRKFRVGTALEALLFEIQNKPHPDVFIVLKTLMLDFYLYWGGDHIGIEDKFYVREPMDVFPKGLQVFVVEDLEPKEI